MDQDELRRLRSLLLKFQRAHLDRPKRRPTFMEVAGVERREVTISKILAFFLDSEAVHGMGDLWLKAFLRAASDSEGSIDPEELQTSPCWCSTEVVTETDERNLRIDIVTQTPDLVLGIENKIGASLYNDLAAYAGQVRHMADGRRPLLVTLTLNDESEATAAWVRACKERGVALCNVTYDTLFAHVRESFGEVLLSADQEWITYMHDFMRTIENLKETSMQFDAELFAFMSENEPEIGFLLQKVEEVATATKAQGTRLQAAIAQDEEILAMGLEKPRVWSPGKYYLWCSSFINIRLPPKGAWAHPEIANNLDKMQVRCWVNGSAAKEVVKDAMLAAGIPIEEEHSNHLVYRNLPLETTDEELISELKALLRALLPIVSRQ